jgi:hypothetical protein
MKKNVVIPRLAQRAEVPRKRSIASAKYSAPTSEWSLPIACVTRIATERSLAVCAARDDHE